jgi:hypothetical protein
VLANQRAAEDDSTASAGVTSRVATVDKKTNMARTSFRSLQPPDLPVSVQVKQTAVAGSFPCHTIAELNSVPYYRHNLDNVNRFYAVLSPFFEVARRGSGADPEDLVQHQLCCTRRSHRQ